MNKKKKKKKKTDTPEPTAAPRQGHAHRKHRLRPTLQCIGTRPGILQSPPARDSGTQLHPPVGRHQLQDSTSPAACSPGPPTSQHALASGQTSPISLQTTAIRQPQPCSLSIWPLYLQVNRSLRTTWALWHAGFSVQVKRTSRRSVSFTLWNRAL